MIGFRLLLLHASESFELKASQGVPESLHTCQLAQQQAAGADAIFNIAATTTANHNALS